MEYLLNDHDNDISNDFTISSDDNTVSISDTERAEELMNDMNKKFTDIWYNIIVSYKQNEHSELLGLLHKDRFIEFMRQNSPAYNALLKYYHSLNHKAVVQA